MLDLIKRRLENPIGKYDWRGETVFIKRLNASAWLTVQKLVSADADNDEQQGMDFYVQLLAMSLCDESGCVTCNNDEGRAALRELGLGDLKSLGELSLIHSGMGEQEKN